MAKFIEAYRTASIWQLSSGRYGVRGYTTPTGSETDESFSPTYTTIEEARQAIEAAGF